MLTFELLRQLKTALRQRQSSIRIDHVNLETVYVDLTDDCRVLVHDRGYVYNYLSGPENRNYHDWSRFGIEKLRTHCDQHSLRLEDLSDEDDASYRISGIATTDDELAELVDRVAACQDAIFEETLEIFGPSPRDG